MSNESWFTPSLHHHRYGETTQPSNECVHSHLTFFLLSLVQTNNSHKNTSTNLSLLISLLSFSPYFISSFFLSHFISFSFPVPPYFFLSRSISSFSPYFFLSVSPCFFHSLSDYFFLLSHMLREVRRVGTLNNIFHFALTLLVCSVFVCFNFFLSLSVSYSFLPSLHPSVFTLYMTQNSFLHPFLSPSFSFSILPFLPIFSLGREGEEREH